ncbi:MAG: hypothetical protein WAL12_02655 [Trebonia sp.]
MGELLLARPEYRRRWQEQASRRRSDAISQAGVARVIALYLWGSGERADSDTSLPRDLKDRVRRALAGESLTPETLTWFVEAFGMDPHDERSLWATFAGDRDLHAGISYTITTSRELALRQRHRTVALFERYAVSADHGLSMRRTLQTIMALEDGVDVYPFSHEPTVQRIDVVYGGILGQQYVHGGGLHTDAIILDRKLRNGETASLEYACSYRVGGLGVTEVRRPTHGRSENIDIAVQFHEVALPQAVLWAVWSDHREGDPVTEEPVSLDARGSVHRFVRFAEETVVGFRWEW